MDQLSAYLLFHAVLVYGVPLFLALLVVVAVMFWAKPGDGKRKG